MTGVSETKNVGLGRLIADRMRGVKYGCVQAGDGKTRFVRSDELINLNKNIGEKFGTDCLKAINADEYAGIMKMTKKFAGEAPQTNNFPLKYFNAHGAMQIVDNSKGKVLVSLVEHLKSPIKTFLKSALK